MADQPVQMYENHVRHDRVIYTVVLLQLVALIVAAAGLFLDSTRVLGAGVLVSVVGSALTASMARGYGVKLQDRIIRLEMRLRLERLLPEDLKGRVTEFTVPQLTALRFASDEELPDLARRVLEERITKGDDIKKQVKSWQADWHRV